MFVERNPVSVWVRGLPGGMGRDRNSGLRSLGEGRSRGRGPDVKSAEYKPWTAALAKVGRNAGSPSPTNGFSSPVCISSHILGASA